MQKQTILETDYATLWYHPDGKIVHHQYHKYIYGQEFRQVLEKGLEIFKEHNAYKWLSDDRKNSAIPREDGEWALTDWNPRVMEQGWKYWAIVMPDKISGQSNMGWFIQDAKEKGLEIQLFEDPDEALAWLRSVD